MDDLLLVLALAFGLGWIAGLQSMLLLHLLRSRPSRGRPPDHGHVPMRREFFLEERP